MDRTSKTFIAVFTLVASLLMITERAVNEVPLEDWWLAGVLLFISLGFWAWLWRESVEETSAMVVSSNGAVQEWIISKEEPEAEAVAEEPEVVEEVDPEPESVVAEEPEVVEEAEPEEVEEVIPEPEPVADERAEVIEEVVDALPDDAEVVEEAKNGEPAAEAAVGEAMAASPKGEPESIAEKETEPDAQSMEVDDLERVEGIGPKYSAALIAAGITTFAQVAEMSVEQFEAIAKESGMRRSASMATWAEQAKLAAADEWDALDALQEELSGGRR